MDIKFFKDLAFFFSPWNYVRIKSSACDRNITPVCKKGKKKKIFIKMEMLLQGTLLSSWEELVNYIYTFSKETNMYFNRIAAVILSHDSFSFASFFAISPTLLSIDFLIIPLRLSGSYPWHFLIFFVMGITFSET